MATGTRSLPTDSPVPYFQPIERGPMSEGRLSDMDSQGAVFSGGIQIPPCHVNSSETAEIPGGIGYHPIATESDRLSAYTGLDDYDTLFEARHGRGPLDHVHIRGEEVVITSSMGVTPTTLSTGLKAKPMDKVKPTFDNEPLHTSQREHVSMRTDPLKHGVVFPNSGHIIGEGATIFTDMMETMLTALDQQMARSSDAQKPEGSLNGNIMTAGQITGNNQVGESQARTQITSDTKDVYPDLHLPVAENYRISDQFCGYLDSLSADNNPLVLVKLKGLSYQYGASIYAVYRVNGTMYGKFSVGYRIIHEKVTVIPQFKHTSLEDEYNAMQPTYANTLPGTTSIVTPIAKSTPTTQASQMPTIPIVSHHERDILEPSSSEQARAAYLERQIWGMISVRPSSDMPSLEDMLHESKNLSRKIQNFCQEWKDKRKYEWESLKVALEKMKKRRRNGVISKPKKKETLCTPKCYKTWTELGLLREIPLVGLLPFQPTNVN